MNSTDSLSMTLATGYHARARPLWEGLVDTGDLSLKIVPMRDDGERHRRFQEGEFDAAELSLALYLTLKSRGAPVVALPIFPNRRFRHAFLYVREGSTIRKPQDLKGKIVGIPSYLNTCGLWVRGILNDEYGVAVRDILWKSMRSEAEFAPPAGVRIELLSGKKNLCSRLLEGELDAAASPDAAQFRCQGVRQLFAPSKEIEKDYYSRTGIFPISHAVAIRRRWLDEQPWVAQKLFDAWNEAKRIALEDDADPTYSNFAWIGNLWEEERALFGVNPWPYGIAPNEATIEALIRHAVEQGILKERLEPGALFFPVDE
ncbi:MAG: ABC transporter substrate-binding protein [Candidatus Binatia bacterium]